MLAFTHMHLLTIASFLLFLSGCATVRVVDSAGKPIPNAEVFAISLSMNTGPNITDQDGYASVPYNVQGTKWIAVSCVGYKDAQVNVPPKFPIELTLIKP